MFEELASALQANGGSATGQMDAGMLGLLQKALQSTNGVTSPSDPSGLTGGAALRADHARRPAGGGRQPRPRRIHRDAAGLGERVGGPGGTDAGDRREGLTP